MAKFKVELSSKARKFYTSCSKDLVKRLDVCFEELENDPYRGSHIKLLKTSPQERIYRYRIGNFRVLYEIYAKEVVVLIIKISKREDAYKGM